MKVGPLLIDISSTRLAIRAGQCVLVEQEVVLPTIKPFVKWPGGKQWLASAAPHLVPGAWRSGRYYEPFAGGAAFFFALEPAHATLSDLNRELITTYRAVRSETERVIQHLRRYPYDEDFYYRIREAEPRATATTAARLLYLNRTCWNGLYRVNREGKFNTPFGRFRNPTVCDTDRLRTSARLLRRARLRHGDFGDVVAYAKRGDFVYFDPPYITGHLHNGFLKYNAPLFSWADQQRLARVARELAVRGVYVLISNADHSTVSALYSGFHSYRVRRLSLIAGPVESRGPVTEMLISSYPILNRASEAM